MTTSTIKRSLLDDLKMVLPAHEFEQIEDAPYEWLAPLYPDINRFGVNGDHIHNMMAGISGIVGFEAKGDFVKELTNEILRLRAEAQMADLHDESIVNVVTALDVLGLRPVNSDYILDNHFSTVVSTNVVMNTITALQVRDAITNNACRFSQENYDELTHFVRTRWGRIHPDDEDLMGGN